MSTPSRFAKVLATGAVLALCVGGLEIATRLVIRKNPTTGLDALSRVTLLPLRPSENAIREAYARTANSTYLVRDQTMGWTIKPNGRAGEYSANAQGIRTDPTRTFAAARPTEGRRILAVGDSFTHGDGVPLDATWEAQLEAMHGDLEVLNLGGPGYGTDQAFLRWRKEGRAFEAHVVVLGIWPENIARNLNILRFLMTPDAGLEMSKPRFILDDGELVLINSPTLDEDGLVRALTLGEPTSLMRHDFWRRESEQTFRPYFHLSFLRVAASVWAAYERKQLRQQLYEGTRPEGNEITVAIARAFAREVRASGASPLVLIMPMRELLALQASPEGLPLVRALKAEAIPVVDLGPSFFDAQRTSSVGDLFQPDGHLTREGNAIVARVIAPHLFGTVSGTAESGTTTESVDKTPSVEASDSRP
ncbi:MAG: hypothetical protein IPK13_13275 [Deltaproteobacteria bacterium]|nr:hypothetical protein [Deltaproteobacteria bacterium]